MRSRLLLALLLPLCSNKVIHKNDDDQPGDIKIFNHMFEKNLKHVTLDADHDNNCPQLQRRAGVKCPLISPIVPTQSTNVTRLVAFSDTHGAHKDLHIPPGDILIFGGDFLNISSHNWTEEVLQFDTFLASLPHPHKVLVPGNHDTVLDHSIDLIMKKLVPRNLWLEHAEVLINENTVVENLTVSGLPHTFLPPQMKETKEKKKTMPFLLETDELMELAGGLKEADILVTHIPPWNIGSFHAPHERGSKGILKHVMEKKPKLHLFGHAHHGRGVYTYGDLETVFVNIAVGDKSDNTNDDVVPSVTVVDINKTDKSVVGIYV